MGIQHAWFHAQRITSWVTGTKRFVEGQWIQKCPSSDCIRPGVSSGTVPVRHTSKSWLAAVTRTVEWRTGAMCVSQWLTCFQKSQDLMESGVYHCQCLNKYNKYITVQMDMHIQNFFLELYYYMIIIWVINNLIYSSTMWLMDETPEYVSNVTYKWDIFQPCFDSL